MIFNFAVISQFDLVQNIVLCFVLLPVDFAQTKFHFQNFSEILFSNMTVLPLSWSARSLVMEARNEIDSYDDPYWFRFPGSSNVRILKVEEVGRESVC